MAMDPYQPCLCGSGKSFKWCCMAIYPTVRKAQEQLEEKQAEAALHTIQQLADKYPDLPAALGYRAEIHYLCGKVAEAEELVQKALQIDPNFAFGHWLRGGMRLDEGERLGALIEYRKAAELYDPRAKDILARIWGTIFEIELKFNRPVAAHLALERAIHADPSVTQLREAKEVLFGKESRLPRAARIEYALRPAPADRKDAWKSMIQAVEAGKLTQAIKAFEQLLEQDANDAAAWFNLGLLRAWFGDHPKALEALYRSIDLDNDLGRTGEAASLCEVLKCGEGMQEEGDYAEYRYMYPCEKPEPVFEYIQQLMQSRRLIGVDVDQEKGLLTGLLLEEAPSFGDTQGPRTLRALCYFMFFRGVIRIWSPSEDLLDRAADEIEQKLDGSLGEGRSDKARVEFGDICMEAMLYPDRDTDMGPVEKPMRDHARDFFEETWLNRPLHALAGMSPIDAANHPTFRKRLPGLIDFIQDCFNGIAPRKPEGDKQVPVYLYDFNRLRRKLGLIEGEAGTSETVDFDSLSVSELAAIPADSLEGEALLKAFRAAQRLDARELASHYAEKLTASTPQAGMPDRYPIYAYLIQKAWSENDFDTVQRWLDAGEQVDRDYNNGTHQSDYALRRAQLFAKRGNAEKATEIFTGIIQNQPEDLKNYSIATEAMLSQKQGALALQFAELGLAKARSLNNRDSEQYFLELQAAAKKQMG